MKRKIEKVIFNLIIIIGVVGILSMFTPCAYGDYTKRTYVSEGISLSSNAKTASVEFYKKHQRFPNDNLEAKLAVPTEIIGQATKSIAVKPNGVIIITYNRKVKDNAELWIQAVIEKEDISWECIKGNDPEKAIEPKFLPTNCRYQLQQAELKELKEE